MRCLLHNVGVSTLVSAQRTRGAPGPGFPSTRPSPLQPSSARAGAVASTTRTFYVKRLTSSEHPSTVTTGHCFPGKAVQG